MYKRNRFFRILPWICLVAVAMVIAGIAVVHSRAFHRYVLNRIVEEASQATGGRVEIGSFQFRWSGLRLDLNKIVLHGTEAASRAPLVQVDHLLLGLKIISIWRRKIDLSELVIDRPSIDVFVDQNGKTNLPQPPPRAPGTPPTNIFNLAIGHFVVNQGDLDYNDRQIPLNGEVHGLNAEASFDFLKMAYQGSVGYHDGRIQLGEFNPVQHSLQAHFGATAAALTLDSLTLNAGSSTLSAQAQLQNYSNPTVNGSYQAAVSTGEVGNILKTHSLPLGQVDLDGTLNYVARAGRPLVDNVTLAGRFHSPALAIDLPQAHANVRALSGEYRLSGGTLQARNVQAVVLGGRMSGDLSVAHLSDRPRGEVAATLRNVSLDALSAAVGERQVQRAAITGKLDGTVKGWWEGSGKDLQLKSDATITASAPVAAPGENAIPLQGVLHLAYNGPSGAITLNHTEFTTPHTTVELDGSTGKQSSLSIRAHSGDLREIDQLALIARGMGNIVHKPTAIQPFGISGSGTFQGDLRESTKNLQLDGQLSGANLQYQGTTLSALKVNVALSPSSVTLSQGDVQTGDHGRIQFNFSAGLKNWSYTPQGLVRVDLTAARLPAATVQRIANLHFPVTGTLAARISMHGTQANLAGQGSATLTQAMAWNQPIQNLSVQFQGAGTSISSTLQLQTPAGSASGKLNYDFKNQAYDAQLNAPGLQLQKLDIVNRGILPVTGVVTASLQGRGTVKNPELAATLQVSKLQIGQETLNGTKIQAAVAQQKATVALDSAAEGASIQARANVNLDANYDATATVDVGNVQLGPLLAAYLPQAPAGLHGQTELHVMLHGPLKQRARIEAEVDIPTLNLAYRSFEIDSASAIRAVYRGGVLSLEPCTLKGTGTNLQIEAALPFAHAGSLQAKANGNIDLHLIQLFYPQWDSSGQLGLDLEASGALAHPNLQGTVRVIDAALEPQDAPLGAQKLNAVLAIRNGRLDIQSFSAEAGGGTLSATGFVTLQPAVQYNVSLAATGVRLRYPVGTRTIFDSNLLLIGSSKSALLSGRVVIDRLSLTKDFDLSTFADQFTESSAVSFGPSLAQNIKLNVSVNSSSDMEVANSQLSLQGSANLTVHGTASEPVIMGRTDITGGELFFNGNRYQVQSGVISFVNPVQTEPVVSLHVTTNINQFDLTMNFEGPIDRMRTSYTSDPPLAPVDIINLIATGQTTEAASASPTTPQSVIAGQLTSQFSNRVQKLAGISSLTIDPQVGGAQNNGVARLGVQQRVTKNLFFSFSTDLTNSNEQVIQVEYQLTKRFAISTMRDQNGIYTLLVKMHKSF